MRQRPTFVGGSVAGALRPCPACCCCCCPFMSHMPLLRPPARRFASLPTLYRAVALETKAFERLQMEEEMAMGAEADARKRAADKKAALTRRLELQTQMVRWGGP